jgi:hypothetical protein
MSSLVSNLLVLDGYGTLLRADGSYCVGKWNHGQKNGTMKLHYSNGDSYTGEWKGDLMHGPGTMHCTYGMDYTGKSSDSHPRCPTFRATSQNEICGFVVRLVWIWLMPSVPLNLRFSWTCRHLLPLVFGIFCLPHAFIDSPLL